MVSEEHTKQFNKMQGSHPYVPEVMLIKVVFAGSQYSQVKLGRI